MVQKQISSASICDQLPSSLSAKCPLLVAQNAEDNFADQIFYTINDPLCHYQCRIPELQGRRIRGCFHGWLILSNHAHWFLWNPVSSKVIRLPPLILKDGDYESIRECCLTSPPDNPNSLLLLTRTDKPTFVFCRLDRKRKRLRWIEMSYATQLKRIPNNACLVHSLTCCNDNKVYALNSDNGFACLVIHVHIVVKDREVVIRLRLFGGCPIPSYNQCSDQSRYLKGFGTELFCIIVGFNVETKKSPVMVSLFRLDMTNIKWDDMEGSKNLDMSSTRWEGFDYFDYLDKTIMMWEDMDDLKDAIFYVDLARDFPVFYNTAIPSELGGYVHIRSEIGKSIYSYHVKDKAFSLSTMPSLVLSTSHVSMLEGDHGEASRCTADVKKEDDEKEVAMVVKLVTGDEIDFNESHLLNVPFHILEMIMEHCVGVEYMNFRATCKRCQLAAPVIKWNNETAFTRLQTYSLSSPWLMVLDKQQGIITFTDPMFGEKYSIKSQVSIIGNSISCLHGWLLIYRDYELVFYNPFTRDIRKLPYSDNWFENLCFSAPPTSPDCMVVGLTTGDQPCIHIHFVAREPTWQILHMGANPYALCFPTFVGQHLYALCITGQLYVFKGLGEEDYSCKPVNAEISRSRSAQYFLVRSDQDLLLVTVYDFREPVEVFKLNTSTEKWEKIEGLGRHMIYICGTTCVCVEAKIPQMENKIYLPQSDSKNGRIVFYSLETSTYHTFNGKNTEESFSCTSYHHYPHMWIEPSWLYRHIRDC